MTDILIGTHHVRLDEPCFCLSEFNLQSPDYKGFRRYQSIKVVRNDMVTEMRKDLGPAKQFKAEEFCLVGGWKDERGRIHIEETVGRMLDMAEYLRHQVNDWSISSQDLLKGYTELIEQKKINMRRN